MRSLPVKHFLALLLCLALIFKGVIPVGYMPDLSALNHGSFKITICPGHALKEVADDQNLKEAGQSGQHGHDKKSGHDLCPFGAAPHVALLFFILTLTFFAFVVYRRFPVNDDRLVAYSITAAWPRGPPVL